jgi:hypothetical protein
MLSVRLQITQQQHSMCYCVRACVRALCELCMPCACVHTLRCENHLLAPHYRTLPHSAPAGNGNRLNPYGTMPGICGDPFEGNPGKQPADMVFSNAPKPGWPQYTSKVGFA